MAKKNFKEEHNLNNARQNYKTEVKTFVVCEKYLPFITEFSQKVINLNFKLKTTKLMRIENSTLQINIDGSY